MSTTSGRNALAEIGQRNGPRLLRRTSVVEEMFQTDDYRWLATPEARSHWQALCHEPVSNPNQLLKRLRSKLTAAQASILLEQLELQSLAKRKVANPSDWFWTRQLLEQSSDQATANETALDFPSGKRVVDICCGAGADSVALANRNLEVFAIDRCPIACELTRHNALSHGLQVCVADQAAEQTNIDEADFVHIDPDRRADGTRSSSLDRLSPGWDTIVQLLDRCQGMSLKLAPGTRVDFKSLPQKIKQPPQSIRFISKDGSVRQQRWYWRLERWPSESVTASMHLNEPSRRRAMRFADLQSSKSLAGFSTQSPVHAKDWFHETFLQSEILATGNVNITQSPAEFVADFDPAIRAAELSVHFANRYGWQLIDSDSGYLTSANPSVHPMVRWFRVLEILPLDKKQIKSYSKSANIRTWELKSRGLEVDLDALRKVLHTESGSSQSMTILCTKLGNHHRAILCKEFEDVAP